MAYIGAEPLKVNIGGTGVSSMDINGVVVSGTNPTANLAAITLSNGQMIIGSTGTTPAAGTITSTGGTISVTTGAGTLNLEVNNSGTPWVEVTGATQLISVDTGYITNRGGGVTYTLPATATQGDSIRIAGKLGAWTIAQNANQAINVGSTTSTTGVTGSVSSSNVNDAIELLCIVGGGSTIWTTLSMVGNLTVA